jgi:DNA-binding MarR family transcriptional regulator
MGASRVVGAKHHAPFRIPKGYEGRVQIDGRDGGLRRLPLSAIGDRAGRERGSIESLYNVYDESEQKAYGGSELGSAARYSRLPDLILLDKGLSPAARCVYAVLARETFQGTTASIGQRRIAGLLGLHVETVNRALHQLESRRHISIRGVGKNRRTYHLHSMVFGQKQRAGIEEVISSRSRTPRLASIRRR